MLFLFLIQFNNYQRVNGCISEYDFVKLILSYSSMNDQAKKKYMKRIRKRFGKVHTDCPDSEVLACIYIDPLPSITPSVPAYTQQGGIAFEDLRAFTQLVESISDVEMALGMYMAAGASITAGTCVYTHWASSQLLLHALVLSSLS